MLDSRLSAWSDPIKDIGNEGAHQSESTLTREDVREALRFVEALLDDHYPYRVQYDEFVQLFSYRCSCLHDVNNTRLSRNKSQVRPPTEATYPRNL